MPNYKPKSGPESEIRPTPDDHEWLDEIASAAGAPKRKAAIFMWLGLEALDEWRFRAALARLTGKNKPLVDLKAVNAVFYIFHAAKLKATGEAEPDDATWRGITGAFTDLLQFGLGQVEFHNGNLAFVPQHPVGELISHALAVIRGSTWVEACDICGRPFIAQRKSAIICSSTCASIAHRKKKPTDVRKPRKVRAGA